ncbi:uncharacterized protein LOC130915813 [Corythoichthys intestinalis]|uniref:uncharacterized protein LOC130915813 n=1 Tax=Corythoichthys intestinalis TaxID=161448 RepID=UPI0025A4EE82|nr:uncharacterized protein LOC130915813 [Corythoichthys intestinalis]
MTSVPLSSRQFNMANWTDSEIRLLLDITAEKETVKMFNGTSRDAVIYDRITRKVREAGVHRTKTQVVNKLKTMKRRYHAVVDHNRKSGTERLDFLYYEQCDAIWGSQRTTASDFIASNLDETAACSSVIKDEPSSSPPPPPENMAAPCYTLSFPGRAEETSDAENTSLNDSTPLTVPTRKITPPAKRRKTSEQQLVNILRDMENTAQEHERERWAEQRKYEEQVRREDLVLREREVAAVEDMTSLLHELVNRQQLVNILRDMENSRQEHERERWAEQRKYEEEVRREAMLLREREVAAMEDMTSLLRELVNRLPYQQQQEH